MESKLPQDAVESKNKAINELNCALKQVVRKKTGATDMVFEYNASLSFCESVIILKTIVDNNFSYEASARALKISRATLYRKLTSLHLTRTDVMDFFASHGFYGS